MPKRIVTSPIVWAGITLAAIYVILANIFPLPLLIQILNGIFVGMFISVVVAYFGLGWHTLRLTMQTLDRVDIYGVSMEILWVAGFLTRALSIYYRVIHDDDAYTDTHFTAIITYMMIISGCLQVSTLDPTEGWLSRRRRLLYLSATLGALVAITLIIAQGIGTGELALLAK